DPQRHVPCLGAVGLNPYLQCLDASAARPREGLLGYLGCRIDIRIVEERVLHTRKNHLVYDPEAAPGNNVFGANARHAVPHRLQQEELTVVAWSKVSEAGLAWRHFVALSVPEE